MFRSIITQSSLAGAFRVGGELHARYSATTGCRLTTEAEVQQAFSRDQRAISGEFKQAVEGSAQQNLQALVGRAKTNAQAAWEQRGRNNTLVTA